MKITQLHLIVALSCCLFLLLAGCKKEEYEIPDIELNGIVIDTTDGTPVPHAKIKILKRMENSTTLAGDGMTSEVIYADANGRYHQKIQTRSPRSCSVSVEMEGKYYRQRYMPYTVDTLVADPVAYVRCVLKRSSRLKNHATVSIDGNASYVPGYRDVSVGLGDSISEVYMVSGNIPLRLSFSCIEFDEFYQSSRVVRDSVVEFIVPKWDTLTYRREF